MAAATKAITLKPDLWTAWSIRGNARREQGSQDAAIDDYTKAIALRPGFADAYNNRAWTYHHLKGEDAKGPPDAERAVALQPKVAEALETRAEIHERLGQRAEAPADYRAARELNPNVQGAENGLRRPGAAP